MEIGRDLCRVEIRQVEGEPSDSRRVFITAVVSSGEEDGHGTVMSERTLDNFAADLKNKIQFKDSHRLGQGFGVSTDGRYEDDLVYGDFKLIRGWPLQNASYPSSDVFIDAIEEEVITRVSVGFSGGKRICNICDAERDYFRCYHWPGRNYEKIDPKTGKSEMVRCIVTIDDARLCEVSAVSKGSNPDAMITEKAERCLREGKLPPDVQLELEEMYGQRFDTKPKSVMINGWEEDKRMDGTDVQKDLESTRTELAEAKQKVAELEPLAECGRHAREDTQREAMDAYKASRGKDVDEKMVESVSKRLATLPYRELVGERDHYRSLAPAKPAVEPGSQTTQPDSTQPAVRDESGTDTRGVNPPHWGV